MRTRPDILDDRVRGDLNRLRHHNPPPNPVTTFSVTPNANSWGATAKFTLGADVTGIDSMRLLRNTTTDLSSAAVIQSWPVTVNDAKREFQFIDMDKTLTAATWYWVEAMPTASQVGAAGTPDPSITGPQSLSALNASLLPPDPIADFSVSESTDQGGFVIVYVAFAKPTDPSFNSVQIEATNYLADTNEVAVSQSSYSPFSYTMVKTGEVVTLRCVSISQTGIRATSGPTLTLTLNGTETVPAKLENIQILAIIDGIQIGWDASPEPHVTSYKVWRAAHGAGFGAATLIHTTTASGSNHYNFLDNTGLAFPGFDYFVQAVSSVGVSTPSTVIQGPIPPQNMDDIGQGSTYLKVPQYSGRQVVVPNANFEASSALPPAGWGVQNATLTYETVTPAEGTQTLKVTSTAANGGVFTVQKFPVTVGDGFFVAGNMKGDGSSAARTSIVFLNSAGANIGQIDALGGSPTSASYNVYTNSGTAPAGAVSCQIVCQNYGTVGSTAWFDGVQAIRQSSFDNDVQDGATFRRLKYVDGNNTISVSTALNPQASIVPGQAVVVTVGSITDTTALATWTAQSIKHSDGSVLSLLASTGGTQISLTSMSASTSYLLYLKITAATGVLSFVGSVTPPPLFSAPSTADAINGQLDGFIGLQPVKFTTLATGGSGGSTTGGGGDTCPWSEELVEVIRVADPHKDADQLIDEDIIFRGIITAKEVRVFDWIKGRCFVDGKDVFRRVQCVRETHISSWRMLKGHRVSPTEAVWDGVNWVCAFRHPESTFDDLVGTRIDISVEADDYNNYNYWLVGETPLLIHNGFVIPC